MKRNLNIASFYVLAVCVLLSGMDFILGFHGSMAYADTDILFYAPFDEGLDAVRAGGARSPVSAMGENRLVEGHSGKGLLVGGAGSGVSYLTAGNLDADAGSIAMWIKPLDWNQDSYTRFFFRMNEEGDSDANGFLWLYKLNISSICWLAQQRTPQTMVYIIAPRATGWPGGGDVFFDWQQGQWSHVIASWSGNQMSLFVNGQYVESTYLPCTRILKQLANTFLVGGANQKGNGVPDAVIDDLLILRQPVTPDEAKLLYEKGVEALCQQSSTERKPALKLQAAYSNAKKCVIATSSVIGRRPDDLKGLKLSYKLLRGNTSDVVFEGSIPIKEIRQTINIALNIELPDGECCLRYRWTGDDMLADAETRFEKTPKAQWADNTLGITKDVPPPFTAMERKGNSVSCWERKYDWGHGAIFPQHINAQGEELLARPITLEAVVNGERCTLRKTTIQWNTTSVECVTFTAAGYLNDLPVSVKGSMEFDGFLWCQILVGDSHSLHNQHLSSLVFDIPLRRDIATLMHGKPALSGAISEFNGTVNGTPVIWLGDEKRGLQWSTQDTRDWHLNNPRNMVRLDLRSDEATLRFTLLDHAIESDRPLEYTMGLQATPVKPLDQNFRSWELKFEGNDRKQTAWQYWWPSWNRRSDPVAPGPYGYMVTGPNTMDELKTYRAQNLLPYLYFSTALLWVGDPVLTNNRIEWSDSLRRDYGGQWDGCTNPSAAGPFTAVTIYPDQSNIRDYFIWRNWKTLTDNPELAKGVAGYYLDVCQPTWKRTRNQDGDYYNLYTLLGTRELQKRFYFMLKKEWPDLLISNHQSADTVMSQLAFSDMQLTGEHLMNNPRLGKELGYYHVLSLAELRAEYTSAKFGIPIIFLPETLHVVQGDPLAMQKIAGAEGVASSEHLVGMLWVHDIIPWIAYVNKKPFLQALRTKEAFGWDRDTQFVGYWEANKLVEVKSDQSSVVTSLFLRKNKVLFVTMNNSDTDAHVDLQPNWSSLKIQSPAPLTDAYNENSEKVSLVNGTAHFTVKARNFRAFVAESMPSATSNRQ